MRSNGMTEAGFLELMRGDIARQQLIDAVTAGARVPECRGGADLRLGVRKALGRHRRVPVRQHVPEPPMPDEAAARRWYDNHPDLYATPEYRR
jgi:peptidyl-prolyl cis-trans isomerase D